MPNVSVCLCMQICGFVLVCVCVIVFGSVCVIIRNKLCLRPLRIIALKINLSDGERVWNTEMVAAFSKYHTESVQVTVYSKIAVKIHQNAILNRKTINRLRNEMSRSSHCRSYWIPHHSAIKSRDNALPSICSGWKWLANWKCKIGTRAEWVQQRLRNNSTMMIMAVMIMVMLVTIMDTLNDYDDCDDAEQVEKIERSMPVAASNRLSNREHLGKAKTAGCCYQ